MECQTPTILKSKNVPVIFELFKLSVQIRFVLWKRRSFMRFDPKLVIKPFLTIYLT